MAQSQRKTPFFVGIDLGGTTLKGALVTPDGAVVHSNADSKERDYTQLMAQLFNLVRDLRDHENGEGQTVAIGIGVPGLVNLSTGRIEVTPNLPELSDTDLAGDLQRETGLQVVLDNNANAAAYGELQVGVARGHRYVLFIGIGSGIGSGIIIDGKVYRGANGFAGEVGHITIDPEGLECRCGNIGCLETVASGPGIVRRTRERLYRDRTSSLSKLAVPRDREFTVADIVRAAREGDEMAQLMMGRTGMFLGIGLAAVINMLNVDMIVLGGSVMEAGDLILKPAINETRRRAFPPSFDSCQIVVAELGTSAGTIGAALLARDRPNQ